VLYNRVSAQWYEECQDDILTVSGMAEDVRDALLEYQVSSGRSYAASVLLILQCSDRRCSNGRCTTRIAD